MNQVLILVIEVMTISRAVIDAISWYILRLDMAYLIKLCIFSIIIDLRTFGGNFNLRNLNNNHSSTNYCNWQSSG